jgi:hypothetical protein
MYSRYAGYRPFDPMSNRLSQNFDSGGEPLPPGGYEPQQIPESNDYGDQAQSLPAVEAPPAPSLEQVLPAAAAALAPSQPNILEALFGGGGNKSRSRRGGGSQGGGLLGSLGNLGDFGGIANLLRSGGGGIAKLLQNFSIDWDAGDILMVLILLFMSLESDDDEILILLALVLVMGV